MLHEILLSLSGQPCSLLDLPPEDGVLPLGAFSSLSVSEKALIRPLTDLGRLNARLQAHCSRVSSSHSSVVCRAVSAAIAAKHLDKFQRKVLDVEKAILIQDSGYVGGYGIVPLSTISGEFAPWTRRLEWLWELICFIQPENEADMVLPGCTGAALIDYLRTESQTGYTDIEEMALHLVMAAETAWMKQLTMWLLYGNLPMFGRSDFFIQRSIDNKGDRADDMQFLMRADLLPKLVSPHTASSILFIGKSLNYIKSKRAISTGGANGLLGSSVTLTGEHISLLSDLKSPVSTFKLANAVTAIRLSLSRSTLSKLLPLPKIVEVLSLLHNFLLLMRGEFAMALVLHAEAWLNGRRRKSEIRSKALAGLGGIFVKENDLAATLTRSFAELYSLQNDEDVDDELDLARDLLRLVVEDSRAWPLQLPHDEAEVSIGTGISDVLFSDFLFPTPTSLQLQIPAPLDLFLSNADISIYSKIHSYLLGIRRAQIRLNNLWKYTSLRRSYLAPSRPLQDSAPHRQSKLKKRREKDNVRTRRMRAIWATGSAALFVLSEIGMFFQGEVVVDSWRIFREWIGGIPSPSTSVAGLRPETALSMKQKCNSTALVAEEMAAANQDRCDVVVPAHDPETLTIAHRRYLSSLAQSLFLNYAPFTMSVRSLLTNIDRFIALVAQLEDIQRSMDLEMDDSVIDNFTSYRDQEKEIWRGLSIVRKDVEIGIKDVVERLREIDDMRPGEGPRVYDTASGYTSSAAYDDCSYVPRKPTGADRLLMKLDF